MTITPHDIIKKEFRRTMRGYSPEEVDEFLQQMSKDYEGVLRDASQLKDQVAKLEDKLTHYYKLEQTLHGALVVAQDTAEEVKNNARKEGQLMVKEAEARAERIVEDAINKSRKMAAEYLEVQKQAEIFRGRLRALLQAQLEMVSSDDWEALTE